MTHRSVAIAVRLTVLLFGAAVVAFALVVRPPAGDGGTGGLPSTHRAFAPGTCATCHPTPSPGPAPSR